MESKRRLGRPRLVARALGRIRGLASEQPIPAQPALAGVPILAAVHEAPVRPTRPQSAPPDDDLPPGASESAPPSEPPARPKRRWSGSPEPS